MKIIKWISNNISLIILEGILALLLYFQLFPGINKEIAIGLIVCAVILTLSKKALEDQNLLKLISSSKKNEQRNTKLLEKQSQYIEDVKNKKRVSIKLLNKLINNGLISEKEILKHLPNNSVYLLHCFAKSITLPETLPGIKKAVITRRYPEFLKKMGFVRSNKISTFYLTTKERLISELTDIAELKNFLLNQFDVALREEWAIYLDKLSKNIKFKKEYEKRIKQTYDEVLKHNFLIIKTKLTEENLGLLFGKRAYNDQVNKILSEGILLQNIKLSSERKIEVRKIVLDSSIIETIFDEETQNDKQKLEQIEGELKQKLKINQLLDYAHRNEKEIYSILTSKFTEEKSNNYAKILKEGASDYEEALKDLGISIT